MSEAHNFIKPSTLESIPFLFVDLTKYLNGMARHAFVVEKEEREIDQPVKPLARVF